MDKMSQHNTKKRINFSIILAVALMIVTLSGCADDIIDIERIPDVDVEISGSVVFKPLVETDVHTRTRGDAPEGKEYTGIKTLYVFFFNSEKQIIPEYSGYVDFVPEPSEGSTHEHVSFTKKIHAGRYYVYAVANISEEQKTDLEKVRSIDELRAFKVKWDDDISKDLEMFGVFSQSGFESAPDNDSFEADRLLTITPAMDGIHSWLRRAVSKVTVDFDGSKLKEGVTVYIRNAVLKDVASEALLGIAPSSVGINGIKLSSVSSYSITYGEGENHSAWPRVTKTDVFSPKDVWGEGSVDSFHDDGARALPCYENMQGEPAGKSKLQDSDGNGIIDSYEKDDVENGTYLEVEGYYVADRPEYKSRGRIIYRFMLGKDAVKNFDLIRNHHYKITMCFKDYGNDIDWHIDYGEKYLDATYPKDVNYQGKFFSPDIDYPNIFNAGHNFSESNVIAVTSYETDGRNKTWIEPEITYTYYLHNDLTGLWDMDNDSSGWLTATSGEVSSDGSQKQYTFTASMTEPISKKINDLFPTGSLGSESVPYNLSNENGKSRIENTANCYMVGAPGWYCFPLVYGNAITDGNPNTTAYSSSNIVNHLKNKITSPNIKDNTGIDLSNVSVRLIWEDAEQLVPSDQISFDPNLFDGIGGIKFHITGIKEGNAVIALIDNNAGEDDYVSFDRGSVYGKKGSTKAIWSWHIWATRFGFGDFEKDIRILNHDEQAIDVMPVNLGWCAGDNPIKYYRRRKCDIKFKVGDYEIIRTIEQYPHFVFPRGDNPYYQWGRKDPFVGTNLAGGNKARWDHDGNKYDIWSQYNPPRLYEEPAQYQNNARRKHTKDCLEVLVKNPDKWHNAPRNPNDPKDFTKGFYSINESLGDLWEINGYKTVYDPCPTGYQVGGRYVFSGFTTTGKDETAGINWYDVLEENMLPDDYYGTSSINSQVLELYTDTRKIQSITFPVCGYRDYDKSAGVVSYPGEGYNGEGYVWYNVAKDHTNSYHLKFIRSDLKGGDWKNRGSLLAPVGEAFYNTDGFAVRPVRSIMK